MSLARVTKRKRRKIQIIKIRNEKGKIATGFTDIKIIRSYSEQMYINKLYNTDEVGKFLKRYQN